MLKLLTKKQLSEMKAFFFFSRKKNEKLTGSKFVLMAVLFVFIAFSCMFAFYGMGTGFIAVTHPMNVDFVYFSIMGVLCLIVGTFGNAFITSSMLYKCGDNEILLSLPIKHKTILISRMIAVYVMGLIFTLVAFVPTVAVYFVNAGFNISVLISSLICLISISLIVLVISCLIGFIITIASNNIRSKTVITILSMLLFIGLYYVIYFRLNVFIQNFSNHVGSIEEFLNSGINPFYIMGQAFMGEFGYSLIMLGCALILAVICFAILSATFIKIATKSSPNKKQKFDATKQIKTKNIKKSLFNRELKRFLNTPAYLINCSFGVLVLIVGSIILLIKKDDIASLLTMMETDMPFMRQFIFVAAVCVVIMISSTNCVVTPSISLEGKSFWIIRSLPIKTKDILSAKLNLHVIINAVPALLFCVVAAYVLEAAILLTIIMAVFVWVYVLMWSCVCLYLGLKNPNFEWTNETVPIKQSGAVAISIFGGWGVAIIVGLAYYLIVKVLGFELITFNYFVFWVAIFALINNKLRKYIFSKGVRKFERL